MNDPVFRFTRRKALKAGALLLGSYSVAYSQLATGRPKRRIFAVSYRALANADRDLLLLRFLVTLTGKTQPKICLLPTATADAPNMILLFYETMARLDCRPRVQRAFINSRNTRSFETMLLDTDAIFVSGGNTLNMLAIWKAQGIDKIVREAYDRGIVLAGESAGSICWFEQGSTDSRPGQVTAMDCLGLLKGSNCPHYDAEPERRPTYQRMVASGELVGGIATDEGVGLVYEDEQLVQIVSSVATARAYRVTAASGKATEEVLETKFLAK